ncbi:uncharacterized protein LOC125179424 [Hyalella azteca]|uniref:Uncharacterized protein LOC125179424 n=1 Tax=Hyalella azteca TaxID=294128 RepID=A0A979FVD2_HYAAZ|nr:uncharacterized protein LOC125179424 [Hyalella azteca]
MAAKDEQQLALVARTDVKGRPSRGHRFNIPNSSGLLRPDSAEADKITQPIHRYSSNYHHHSVDSTIKHPAGDDKDSSVGWESGNPVTEDSVFKSEEIPKLTNNGAYAGNCHSLLPGKRTQTDKPIESPRVDDRKNVVEVDEEKPEKPENLQCPKSDGDSNEVTYSSAEADQGNDVCKMAELLELLSSLQNHLLAYCTRHAISPFHVHNRQCPGGVWKRSSTTASLAASVRCELPAAGPHHQPHHETSRENPSCAEVVYSSVLGQCVGPLVYSLCLMSPLIGRPLLPSLEALMRALDRTNRAVAVVAHITDQDDLMDEQDTPTPDTVKSVGGGGTGVVGRSWLWLLDIERCVALVLGRCIHWMMAGGGGGGGSDCSIRTPTINSDASDHDLGLKLNANSSRARNVSCSSTSSFPCCETPLAHFASWSQRNVCSSCAVETAPLVNLATNSPAAPPACLSPGLPSGLSLHPQLFGWGIRSINIETEVLVSWLEQFVISIEHPDGMRNVLRTFRILYSLNTPIESLLNAASCSQSSHAGGQSPRDAYVFGSYAGNSYESCNNKADPVYTPLVDDTCTVSQVLQHAIHLINHTETALASWMREVEEWDAPDEALKRYSRDPHLRDMMSLLLAAIVAHTSASQTILGCHYSACMLEVFRAVQRVKCQLLSIMARQFQKSSEATDAGEEGVNLVAACRQITGRCLLLIAFVRPVALLKGELLYCSSQPSTAYI